MSLKDWRVRIEDMLDAIERINRYTHGIGKQDFCDDERSVDAVVCNLEIIGEAANRLPYEVQQQHPEVPWSRMAEMRHILVHEYHSVDAELIWSTARHDIPPLYSPLLAILDDEDRNQ